MQREKHISCQAICIRPLTVDDGIAFKALRIAAIVDSPIAVSSTAEEEASRTPAEIQARIEQTAHQVVFGAFVDTRLVAMAGLRREAFVQMSHKATLWGVFVQPELRKEGVARELLMRVVEHARKMGVLQIHLSVNVENHRAKNLYDSLGFETFGLEPRSMRVVGRFYDELLMCLRLDQ
ncbi:GNAT family N-acetyltransferase [Duganella sp. FT135W]|uniref:GNAT family N-acetyltransferase n=2 Tax=Duganella flavida TaxID=2692175 RepID=A0A6L8K9A0_9BURK|nr:GNAT family N-acetyltransferase [Duganella flavida]